MINKEQLKKLKNMPVEKTGLVDIQTVEVNKNKPIKERFNKFIKQINNPYQFLYGDAIINIEYAENGKPLVKLLENCLINWKNK